MAASAQARFSVALFTLALFGAAGAHAQQVRTAQQMPFPDDPDFDDLEVETLHVQGNIWLLAGAGANVAVQVGERDILVVDSGYAEMSDKLLAAIRELSGGTIRTIVNTTLADDHTGGNAALVAAGSLNQAGPGIGGRPNEGDLVGHANLLLLMAQIGADEISTDRWPPSTYSVAKKDLYSNGEPVEIIHQEASTSGDSMVWFRKSDVIVTGELFNMTSFPFIDVANGGHINGVLDGLNDLLEIMVPAHLQEGGTMVVPSHGRIGDEHDVLEYRDMLTIIRDRVQNAVDRGWTLRQIQQMSPSATYEFEPRFDRDPNWSAEMFIDAIYQNLTSGS
jgi:glyoxylase-like metal-dependent hydrolase (beta-lactamase superfamily II)